MTTDWAHLPNAAHIDRVLASAKANPKHWALAWDKSWYAAQDAAWAAAWKATRATTPWDAVRGAAWNAVWAVARDAVRDAARGAAQNAVQDALLALIAYDDCAYMLDSDPGELAILAAFGNDRAILLLRACKAFHSLKTIA